ncbi:helix-turn-helix domain-containing protein [Acetivibrio clariflavus]|uniref:DNA-binding domain-containing protein, AraC-type n=1 Tax=Acetivibrio clariflavus (strain DSM 19732 / NBRC 101661 / EBR45) TaxID=720554 RepID=G8LYI3_ACECE|nr:helix-turn-helix domain-containing protein [Acetivibrio clariflavus]AEV69971.1 DNA-binding domain-containing protein, AraC-type [Acetivibrio clariflavus DSM 19732]
MREQILAVQRMQDYIEAHLNEEITLADLARASQFSPWYARRLFIKWTNLTPAEYIRKLRLSKSALRLRDENCRIIDVALEMGFGSVDGYQRAFAREFGCNPKQYAANPVPLYLFKPYSVKSQYLGRRNESMEKVRNVFIQVMEKPARKAVIKRGIKATHYFEYCEEVGCDVWSLLTSMKSISGEPVCMWLPERYRKPGTSEYVQGVEVPLDYDGIVPEGFDIIELPASKYLMFQGEPFAEEDYAQAIDEIWEAERKYNPSVIGYEWDTENPRIQLEPIGTRGYIELLPIKPL